MRKFEKVKNYENKEFNLPKRSTASSGGYDFFAIEDMVLPKNKISYVKTGIKCKMETDEILMLCNRSSNPKKGLILANGVGIVDSDYYGNEANDGEIVFAFININDVDIIIKARDKIGQGIFIKYSKTDDDVAEGARKGGFGSTGK